MSDNNITQEKNVKSLGDDRSINLTVTEHIGLGDKLMMGCGVLSLILPIFSFIVLCIILMMAGQI